MSARQTLSQLLASINVHKANHDILMAVYDAMYPEKEVYITCERHIYPHVENSFCENSKPWNPEKTGVFNNVLGAPYESKPMEKDSPAVGGCVIPTIKSIVPYVPTTPRNVIADIRESGVDQYVDEPDDNGKRGW